MKESHKKILKYVAIVLGCLAIGFFGGRLTVKEKVRTIVKYISGPTVIGNVEMPKPQKETPPLDTLNLMKQIIKDGIYKELWPEEVVTEYVEVTKDDTTAVLVDYATNRYYSETLFDSDTLGTCSVDFNVQYNRMTSLSYKYTPVIKQITTTQDKVKLFSPFVGVGGLVGMNGSDAIPLAKIDVGIFIKEKYGFEANYQHDFQNNINYYGGTVLFKF
jgi:hypothetical protein